MQYRECTYAFVNTAVRGDLTDFARREACKRNPTDPNPFEAAKPCGALQNLWKPPPFRMSHPKLSKDWNPGTFQKPAQNQHFGNTLEPSK